MSLPQSTPEKPVVMIGNMCEKHRHDLIVRRLKLEAGDSWIAAETVAKILLFQAAMADERITARVAGDVHGSASLVLAEIGCLACYDRSFYRRTYRLLQKGLEHAALVSRGKIADEGFDLTRASGP